MLIRSFFALNRTFFAYYKSHILAYFNEKDRSHTEKIKSGLV